jgi:hypothetical protein
MCNTDADHSSSPEIGPAASSEIGPAAFRVRRPWHPPELTKETVEAATGYNHKLLPISIEILFVSQAHS